MSEPRRPRPAIRAPLGVDLDALEAELSRRQAARRPVEPPAALPDPFVGADPDPLTRARALLGRPGVEYEIGWRTPLLGPAWAAVRETIHGQARLYVDALMARQAELDAALLDAISQLRAEVDELRRALEASTQAMADARPPSGPHPSPGLRPSKRLPEGEGTQQERLGGGGG
jgi:hypothetical protein